MRKKGMMYMTIHTFEVSSMLTNENYYIIQKELKTKDKSKWKAEKNGMLYWGLSDKGILIHMFQVKKKDFYSYYITYRISARRVIDNENFVGLFNTKKYDELEEIVNSILKEKSSLLPKLNKCNLRRLDFCVNAQLENQEQVKAYINTAKRANVPSKLELYEEYNKISKRRKPTKDDFTVYASEYVEISIYNKYMQMKKDKNMTFSNKQIEKAKNIVRMEIRCMEGKLKALSKKYCIRTTKDFMRMGNVIGDELYNYYLKKIFGSGIICTLKEANKRIGLSEYSEKNKELLREFIDTANLSRSVAETIKDYKSGYGKKETKRILFMFDNIDTNYVTVTNTDAKVFKDGYIPTPIELYKEYVK